MTQENEIKEYYTKPITTVGKVEPGSYVFDVDARLCYVDKEYILHSYALETCASADNTVFPVTLETARIMERMAAIRTMWHRARILNPSTSGELRNALREIMKIDAGDKDYGEKEFAIWLRLEKRFNVLVGYAKALGMLGEENK